ncbi:MAG: Do/DeqQ family serine protease [Psychromonas sp.]|jgi:Do/DeqQ family serine protease|uniref:DegQ family serine endoprotease n=1 Tax=Psychromonas sp. TaxID=1884585 RepID=UPI0039E5B729
MKKILLILCAVSISLISNLSFAVIPNMSADGKPYPSLSPILKKINPAVVNIATYSTQNYNDNPLLNDPFFRHFFNLPQQPKEPEDRAKKRQRSAGSGVIVNALDGIVMTNYHVVKNADEVRVSLLDGRSYEAKLVGSDPELDIAILKVQADNLTQINIADSSILEVGDFVIAIGNPFGLGQTVTTGIVSALGRSGLGIEGYENFIQTDASINPGNSGGALVNLAGELVGINTAIIAPSGGNVGIGFAIPANMAKASMLQIVAHGEVRRGQIGVGIQDITPDLREAFALKNGQSGALITSVSKDSPAEKAGIKSGDIIIMLDGRAITSTGELRSRIGIKQIGDKVAVTILRDGKEKQLQVKIGEPQSSTYSDGKLHPLLEGAYFENEPDGNGVVVTRLAPNSIASYSGLRAGDLIVAANQLRVVDMESFKKALKRNKSALLLQINRNGGSFFIVIK